MNNFSFGEYKKIIRYYKKFLKPISFDKVNEYSNNFFIVRHDVEFSTERALELAKIEKKELNIRSSFFFQITNNSYNIFSYENKKIIFAIKKMGHKIGLHFNYKGQNSNLKIKKELISQSKIFNKLFKNDYKFFSPHRPSKFPLLFTSMAARLIKTSIFFAKLRIVFIEFLIFSFFEISIFKSFIFLDFKNENFFFNLFIFFWSKTSTMIILDPFCSKYSDNFKPIWPKPPARTKFIFLTLNKVFIKYYIYRYKALKTIW